MRSNFKSSSSSRTSVRSLIVACMPAAALGIAANSPLLGAVFSQPGDQGLKAEDNSGASTNGPSNHAPSTNSGSVDTNQIWQVDGQRG